MKENDFVNSGFARLYTWMTKAKYTMGIFFVVYVIVFLFFGIVTEGVTASIGFFTAIQMLFACLFIGIMQQVVIPSDKVTSIRCIIWVTSGAVITILFEMMFKWFKPFPAWCFPAFTVFMVLGMLLAVLGDYFELQRETKYLNRKLEKFQNNKPEN